MIPSQQQVARRPSARHEFVSSVLAAYAEMYDLPTRTLRLSRTGPPPSEVAMVVYLPDKTEQLVPTDNLTMLGTAGFGSEPLCADFPCELAMEIKGEPDGASIAALAEGLAHLASAPLESRLPFRNGEILTNVSLPLFPQFSTAVLIDWDSVYGFRFPAPVAEVGLLRIVPLFAIEADFVESSLDRCRGYRALINRGMNPADPHRKPTV
ncbi:MULTISPECIES: hypothetical protein [unclassified Streptomyces]|uniref:hypothetical protein n=1 Tax=unclassified Streptomyces TaxID=2593676 RepID=UPI00081B14CB|nr:MULTISPECIES: hypothetical protein [unclassified Streptomyces]MYQ82412.1 hypothetical protein [Streptomyces sp. SID4936]SCD37707.1 hypothetical protein GA0115234_10094 [Streptomyces sp. DvalAA-43]